MVNRDHLRVLGREHIDDAPGRISTAVVDQNDFTDEFPTVEHCQQSRNERADVRLLVEAGRDDGQVSPHQLASMATIAAISAPSVTDAEPAVVGGRVAARVQQIAGRFVMKVAVE